MKWSFATVGVITLGIIGVAIIMLFQQITTNNENDYYLLKEVTEAAMIDAIDIPYYRETGNLKIVTEKFVENFTRRFAESTIFVTNDYKINFYDIIETPPKVSIIIDTGLGEYTINGNSDEYNIANKLDAILEYTGESTFVSSTNSKYNNPYVNNTITKSYYAMSSVNSNGNFNINYSLKMPGDLVAPNIKNVKIKSIEFVSEDINQGILGNALLQNEINYNEVTTDYMQSISSYATNISNFKASFYNCGTSTSNYICNDINKYYVTLSGSTSDTSKNKVIFKYKIVWTYDEYKFID